MVFRNLSLSVAALSLVAMSVNFLCAQDAEAKGKKKPAARTYFVPPPPAYTPSLTPAIYVNGRAEVAQKTSKKKKEPEKQYVYTREGYEQPKATRPNPYVTYWGS